MVDKAELGHVVSLPRREGFPLAAVAIGQIPGRIVIGRELTPEQLGALNLSDSPPFIWGPGRTVVIDPNVRIQRDVPRTPPSEID